MYANVAHLVKTDMKKILSTTLLCSVLMLWAGCGSGGKDDSNKSEQTEEQAFATDGDLEYTELQKAPMPCSKDDLSAAWKRIGVIELQRKKTLDYSQHSPTLFFPTDLDEDGNPEVLLRSEPPYAAIFSFVEDSLRLITFVDQAEMGLAITPDGIILRNGIGNAGSTFSEFIRLENSQTASSGVMRETFVIKNGTMLSGDTQYMLLSDSAMVKVNKEAYMAVAPQQEGTYLEDIDGWEDFRKP